MKAIVSSKALLDTIRKAIDMTRIQIAGRGLSFYGNKSNDMCILWMEVEDHRYNTIDVLMDSNQWMRLRQFLEWLPEQPIVIEIDQIEDDKISIDLSHIVATF